MVKAYLRYELASSWGVLCSNANIVFDRSGKYLITSALENVALWNPKQGTLVSAWLRRAVWLLMGCCDFCFGLFELGVGAGGLAVPASMLRVGMAGCGRQ